MQTGVDNLFGCDPRKLAAVFVMDFESIKKYEPPKPTESDGSSESDVTEPFEDAHLSDDEARPLSIGIKIPTNEISPLI